MLKVWTAIFIFVLVGPGASQDIVNASGKPRIYLPSVLPFFKASFYFGITCEASNVISMPRYRFYKDGTLLSFAHWGSYYIYRPGKGHAGTYTCTVFNATWESDPSDGIEITFLESPSLKVNNNDPRIGDNITLTCHALIQPPDFHFIWLKDLAVVGDKAELTIDNLTTSDEGEYTCMYTITRTVDNTTYTFTSDRSDISTIVFSLPAQPRMNDIVARGLHGQYSSWGCLPPEGTTAPIQRASLYFDGKKIAETPASRDGGYFYQRHLWFRNAGNYACSLSNKKGESPLSALANVIVEAWEPDRANFIYGWIAPRGQISYVRCASMDDRFTDLFTLYYCTLYINGHRFLDDTNCFFEFEHGITGSYTCTKTNVNSTSIPGPPSSFTFANVPKIKPVSQQLPVSGQNYSLLCETDGSDIAVEWYKDYINIERYNIKSPGIFAYEANVLNITVDESLDGSIYSCRITINGSVIWSEYYILHLTPPTTPTLDGGSTYTNQPGIFIYTKTFGFTCHGYNSELYSLYKDGVQIVRDQTSADFLVHRSGNSGASYTCTARNTFAESAHSKPVYVPGRDDVVWTASTPNATLGQPLTLNCSVKDTVATNITYRWIVYRSYLIFKQINKQNLTFTPVIQGDVGLYICEIETEVGVLSANNYFRIVFTRPMKPAISWERTYRAPGLVHPSSYPAAVYYRIDCTCMDIACDPNNPFRLYKNGLAVKDVEYTGGSSFPFDFVVWRWYIVDITVAENSGAYTCTSLNSVGESEHSEAANIPSGNPVPRISADNPNATLGGNITFTCEVPSGISDYQIQWSKPYGNLFNTGRRLTLLSLSREDHGSYQCVYTENTKFDIYNHQGISSDYIYLVLREPLQPLLEFNIDTAEYGEKYGFGAVFFQFGEGDIVRFRCQSQQFYSYQPVVSENIATYTLFKNGQQIAPSAASGDFNISGLTLGTYNFTCKATNAIGESPFSYPLVVNIAARPVIEVSTVSPVAGINLTLTCDTGHVGDGSDIIWKKNGRILSRNSMDLTLTGLNQYDEGKYICRQKTGAWFLPSSYEYALYLTTKAAAPEIFLLSPTTLDVGSPLYLYCLTTSSTSYEATFYKNGGLVRTVVAGEYDSTGQVLFAYSVLYTASSDAGGYTCEIKNGQGASLRSEVLTVSFYDHGDYHQDTISV